MAARAMARLARRWVVGEVARRAGVSPGTVYRAELGIPISLEAAARIGSALGLRLELDLTDPRRRSGSQGRLVDPVHSAMGELEARHLRRYGFPLGIDEPYQHFQFAGRADLVGWDLERAALLHIENRTRFPDMQEMAGSYNGKRAYLGAALAQRIGLRGWSSETHVIAALWSAEVLHAIRLRTETFRAICPDTADVFAAWWSGDPPRAGSASTLVVLDPLASRRQRPFVGLEDALTARPRHRGYAEAASLMTRAA